MSRRLRNSRHAQNFLKKKETARKIVRLAGISHRDLVLEIGSGKGIITRELVRHAGQVLAVEIDPELVARTRATLSEFRNLEVIEGDFLRLTLPDRPFRVVANIPFRHTSVIVSKLTSTANQLIDAHLIVQREAAMRFTGEPRSTLVATLLHPWFELDVLLNVSRFEFRPVPGVDSSLLRIKRRNRSPVRSTHEREFQDLVTYGFTAWQSSLAAAYRSVLTNAQLADLLSRGLDLHVRPSKFAPGQWIELYHYVQAHVPESRKTHVVGAHRRLTSQQQRLTKSFRTRRRMK